MSIDGANEVAAVNQETAVVAKKGGE